MESVTDAFPGDSSIRKVRLVQVIRVDTLCGTGMERDPVRKVIQFWTTDGKKIGEFLRDSVLD